MAELRFGRGWDEEELADRLARLPSAPLNYDARPCDMTLANGWNSWHSTAPVAHERPGEPRAGGAFERAKKLVAAYAFSDPRIVTGHFDPDAPLAHRPMLLEIRVLGLRYLCGTRVDDVRDERCPERTTWGYRYSTLEGHLERGAEWFLLEQEHATGLVRFSIRAKWRDGDFPNWWSELGFDLLSRRYQRAWHRLAYLRLRRLLGAQGLPEVPRGEKLLHADLEVPAPPLQVMATSTPPPSVPSESEQIAHPRPADAGATLLGAAGMGAVAGMRSALMPALLARTLAGAPAAYANPIAHALGSKAARIALPLAAAGELVADKLPFTPDRTQAPSVFARVVAGASAGAASSVKPGTLARLSLAGGLGALASTFAMHRARRFATTRLKVPGTMAGLAEDALAITLGRLLVGAGHGRSRVP